MNDLCVRLDGPLLDTTTCSGIVEYAGQYVLSGVKSKSYGSFESKDVDSPVYVSDVRRYLRDHGIPRPVEVLDIPPQISYLLNAQLVDYPHLNSLDWRIQIIRGGSFVAPHIDDTISKMYNIVYMIQTGGDPYTTWWKLKDEYKSQSIPPASVVPFNIIEEVGSHLLQQHNWYRLDVSEIHSVSNQRHDRIALTARFSQ